MDSPAKTKMVPIAEMVLSSPTPESPITVQEPANPKDQPDQVNHHGPNATIHVTVPENKVADMVVVQPGGQANRITTAGHSIGKTSTKTCQVVAAVRPEKPFYLGNFSREIRDMIWDHYLESDPDIVNPRTIKLSMDCKLFIFLS